MDRTAKNAQPETEEPAATTSLTTSSTIDTAALNADISEINANISLKKLAQAEQAKIDGNDAFKRGQMLVKHTAGKQNLTQACVHYTKALEILDSLDAKEQAVIDLRASVFLNLAMVSLKFESWDTVINCCKEVLKMKPGCPKALFRQSLAHWGEGDLEIAKECMEFAASAGPKDKMIRSKLAELKKILRAKGGQAVDEKEAQVLNGGETKGYHWSQTLMELHLYMALPKGVKRSKDICCTIRRQAFILEVVSGDEGGEGDRMTTLKKAQWRYPVKVEECIWTLEESAAGDGALQLHLHAQKELRVLTEEELGIEHEAKYTEEEVRRIER
jgi:hypothetical protein